LTVRSCEYIAQHCHRLAEQCLRGWRVARVDHHASALIADGEGSVQAWRHRFQGGIRNPAFDAGAARDAARSERGQISIAEQKAEIRRIERGRFDADGHLVVRRTGGRHLYERELEFAALLHERAKLQALLRVWLGHRLAPEGEVFLRRSTLDA
jgi:hypothetical protein